MKPITVVLAEDHMIVREGLRALLEAEGDITVVGEAETGRQAVQLTKELRPGVVVMDIAMPLLNGLEATRQILEARPSTKILILSAHSDDEYVERAVSFGAAGFLEKQTSAEILTNAIQAVASGKSFLSPAIARRMVESKGRARGRDGLAASTGVNLTSRETEVLQLVAEGQANKQVASTLGISIKTVEKHRQQVMDKLNIHETAGLTRYAIAQGIIESRVQLTII